MQHELKFFKAFREDVELAERLFDSKGSSPRHIILLLHDALEFLFYECLLLNEVDIYENGQNTIGFDKAYNLLVKSGYRLPYVATIREIQKLRGDAKHHAQDVGWDKLSQLVQRWSIICVCVAWDIILPVADGEDLDWAATEYSKAQHSLYQRARNKDWGMALRHLIAAFVHKKCDMGQSVSRPVGPIEQNLVSAFGTLSALMSNGPGSQVFQSKMANIKGLIKSEALKEACEALADVYSLLELENPTQFDMRSAVFITERLALASGRRYGRRGMSWHKWSSSDTVGHNKASRNLRQLLSGTPALVKRFGDPYYDSDEDRYWKWWEFVVFDGREWHSFHLDDSFSISAESYSLSDDTPQQRERAARLALEEFSKAAEQGALADRQLPEGGTYSDS